MRVTQDSVQANIYGAVSLSLIMIMSRLNPATAGIEITMGQIAGF